MVTTNGLVEGMNATIRENLHYMFRNCLFNNVRYHNRETGLQQIVCAENVNWYTKLLALLRRFKSVLKMKIMACVNTSSLEMESGFLTKKWLGLQWFKNDDELRNALLTGSKHKRRAFTRVE